MAGLTEIRYTGKREGGELIAIQGDWQKGAFKEQKDFSYTNIKLSFKKTPFVLLKFYNVNIKFIYPPGNVVQ